MTRFLLDSSAILNMLANTSSSSDIRNFISNGELVTSVICYCEVLNEINLHKIKIAEEFLNQLLIFQVTLADAHLAKEIEYACRKSGGQVPTMDCLIAATASNNNATVITTDSDFSRIDGVKKEVF